MLVYIFYDDDWIESKELFPHDIALLIEMKDKKVYLWFGPYSKKEEREKAQTLAEETMKKYKGMTLEVLSEGTISLKLDAEIEELLGENKDFITKKVERTPPMSIYYYVSYIAIGFLLIGLLNLFRLFQNDMVGGGILINADLFQGIFDITIYMIIISCVLNAIGLICAVWSQKLFLIISGLCSFAISGGLYFYLNNREFLFYFLETEYAWNYLIEIVGVVMVFIWVILGIVGNAIPSIISNKAIKDTSEVVEKKIERPDLGIVYENTDTISQI